MNHLFDRLLMRVLGFLSGTLLLLSCGGCGGFSAQTNASLGILNFADGETAYREGFYAFAQQRGCVQCHASLVHPFFASVDFRIAYSEAKGMQVGSSTPLIDFANPDASIIIVYSGSGHCNASPCSDPGIRPQVRSLLEAWAAAELKSGGGTGGGANGAKYLTSAMPLPSSIPPVTSATPGVLRIPLKTLAVSAALAPVLKDAILEIEIQMLSASEYRLNRPKLAGATAQLNIKGLHVFIKESSATGIGAEDVNQGRAWNSLETIAPQYKLPSALPTGPLDAIPLITQSIQAEVKSTSDVFTVGFDSIELAP